MSFEPVSTRLRHGSASVVVLKGENVLVIGGATKLQLVGGKAEGKESPVETAVREVHEESGLALDPARLVPLTGVGYQKGARRLFHTFFLYRADEADTPKTGAWVPLRELQASKLLRWWGYHYSLRAAEKFLAA